MYAANQLLQQLMEQECSLESAHNKVEFYCPSALPRTAVDGTVVPPSTSLDFVDPLVKGSPRHKDGIIQGFKCLGTFIGQDDWCQAQLENMFL